MLKFNFLPKFSVYTGVAFIMFTVIGTLSHELGHAAVAESLGYKSKINYGSIAYEYKGFENDEDVLKIKELKEDYQDVDYNQWPVAIKDEVEVLQSRIEKKLPNSKNHDFWITIGGPAQTILTSFMGLFVLYIRRKKRENGFKLLDWLGVFLALFILREVFNFATGIYGSVMASKSNFYGDEYRISRYLGLNEWFVPSLTLVLGLMISLYVIFEIVPFKYRFSFMISGLIGGTIGFVTWFGFLGQFLFE